jgi:hypothetical protein
MQSFEKLFDAKAYDFAPLIRNNLLASSAKTTWISEKTLNKST